MMETPEKVFVLVCQLRKWLALMGRGLESSSGRYSRSMTRRSGQAKAKGLSRTELTTEKMEVTAPIPSASVRMAVIANPGDLRRVRALKRRSCRKLCMEASSGASGYGAHHGPNDRDQATGNRGQKTGIVSGSGRRVFGDEQRQ